MSTRILDSRPYGNTTEDRLRQFERSAGVALPRDYRDFLLLHNGGRPMPSFFWVKPGDGSTVNQFYGLHNGPEHLRIGTYAGANRHGIPSTMLVIADDGTGNFIALGIGDSNFGHIFFVDHELHPYAEAESTVGISRLAESFSSFLEQLAEPPAT